MNSSLSAAASLSPTVRQDIGIQVLSRSLPISYLAEKHQVGRKFVYEQGDKVQRSIDETFSPSQGDDDVLSGHAKLITNLSPKPTSISST